MEVKKDEIIRFRCTKEEKESLRSKAKKLNMNISQYCMYLLFYKGDR